MFDTVLIANRGEIACRIISTLRTMGIRSVAVYSDADRGAKHVALADVAVRIGPAKPQSSYLSIEAIIAAAKSTGANAIHPGYGFLSENIEFARACQAAGIVFIGPGVEALNLMGDKIRSKNHVSAHGVPIINGIAEPGLTDEQLIEAAAGIGYPLLVKPSAGGGGKGMEIARDANELPGAISTARRIAAAAFGDDTLFIERYLATPRHIEVQVLADTHGAIISLGERECSLQRRHQKVIEEAPSPLLDPETRERIGAAARDVARSVGYVGAGTVEFLVSADAPTEFFFMEMNTRLQVEHPVTELVVGIDLVEWQILVAAGETLALAQDDMVITGHAIEARVYAENPSRGFLPTTGSVLLLEEPAGEHVRIDSSLTQGLDVASSYDPLLSKVIVWGNDRAEALRALDRALAETTVLGIHTNIEYLRYLVQDPAVEAGDLDTGLIERRMPDIRFAEIDDTVLVAAALHARHREVGSHPGPWHLQDGWRIGVRRPTSYSFATSATEHTDVHVSDYEDGLQVAVGEGELQPAWYTATGENSIAVALGGVTRTFTVATDGDVVWLGERGVAFELTRRDRAVQLAALLAGVSRPAGVADPDVRSPMPGTVVAVTVASGDSVTVGQPLLTVEAMKMEHKLLAAIDGVVTVTVKPADLVKLDQVVATIAPHSTESAPHEGDTK